MKKSTEKNIIKWIIISSFVFFFSWGIYTILTKNYEIIFDKFFTAALILAAFFLYKKINMNLPIAIFSLLTLTLHHLKLYGNFYFGIPFDRIMHFTAGFALVLIFYQFLYHSEKKKNPNKWKISFLSILIAAGAASLIEIVEFAGYSFLGHGEGILFYGTGDFGEWNNLSWDLICNTSGALLAAFSFSIIKLRKRKARKKKKTFKKFIKYFIVILLTLFVSLIAVFSLIKYSQTDHEVYNRDFDKIFELTEINKTQYLNTLDKLMQNNISNFAKGDALLVKGRLTKNKTLICSSIPYFKNSSSNPKINALAYETIASLNCNKDSKEYYQKASEIWKKLNNSFRAELDKKLANNQKPRFIYYISNLSISPVEKRKWNKLIIGKSKIFLDKKDIVISQADRVSRDWLSAQIQSPYSSNLLTVFSEKFFLNSTELFPEIGWHEGARIKELKKQNITHKIASGTIAIKIKDRWYAPDEKGIFRFEILKDKIDYPTTRFLRPNIALIIDTHGISSIVKQAVESKATAVIGCCDHPAKIKAASYLSDKGIKVICLTDRFLPDLLLQEKNILGSPPIIKQPFSYRLGGQPITINKYDKVVVMFLNPKNQIYSLQYYDTPARYFQKLKNIIDINIIYAQITDFNQMHKIIKTAEKNYADVIAVRVFNSDDYIKVKQWLEKSEDHRAVLFHSSSYPYGYKLLKEFPDQTTFDDINPIIV